jgi:hypothetical protein
MSDQAQDPETFDEHVRAVLTDVREKLLSLPDPEAPLTGEQLGALLGEALAGVLGRATQAGG